MASAGDGVVAWRRVSMLADHLAADRNSDPETEILLRRSPCLEYAPPDEAEFGPGKAVLNPIVKGRPAFDVRKLRLLADGNDAKLRDEILNLMASHELFHLKRIGGKLFVGTDYNAPFQIQRALTLKRILFLRDKGLYKGWFSNGGPEGARRQIIVQEALAVFDHSLSIKHGVHFSLWGGAIEFLGTKRHHDKWLQPTEDITLKGCFAMTELGHGSNVRGIETVTTYDPSTQEFIISTPCESAQKYWIGGAAEHATHTVVFSQLLINGKNEGVHAFIAQIRDHQGKIIPGVWIADCGHKIGLNGVDNGRIWFNNLRIPRENLLNSVADVTPEGQYVSSISDPDQRFGAFMAPLTGGRVIIGAVAIGQAKLGLATAIRYGLTRRAFSLSANQPEVLLLDYPSHQRRLLPLLAKTYAMSFASNDLKDMYATRTPSTTKAIHVYSSGYKAMFSWHSIRTLQECREACGGQGLKTENRIGQLKAEFDVQLTFEGDNNILMQQVSKALLADYLRAKKKGKSLQGLGLEHVNGPSPGAATTDNYSLRDKAFQLALFHLRERDLLERLAQEVTLLNSHGLSVADALLQKYQLAKDLGHAFSQRACLESFIATESRVTPGPLQGILALLRSLYVLVLADEEPVFLRYGYLSPKQSQKIQDEIAHLCLEVRPHALALVDAFGFPPSYLGPIAFDWIEANSWRNV